MPNTSISLLSSIAALGLLSAAAYGDTVAGNQYFAYAVNYWMNTPSLTFGSTSATASVSPTDAGNTANATNTATANLATGTLGVLNAGNNAPFGLYETLAQLGDTITASDPSSGLSGLNLGVNLSLDVNTSFDNAGNAFSYLWVYMLTPGTFNSTGQWTVPSNILYSRGFILGTGTASWLYDSFFTTNNVSINGIYGDGNQSLPLAIPFNTIGSNFEIDVVLGSVYYNDTSGGATWSADLLDPLQISLTAPQGVELTSASGVFPVGTSTPEPSMFALLGIGFAAMAGFRSLLTRSRRRSA